ncbi:MBL fold metallo-hydrolase [Odoribacter sp. OttesenSCG-928-A06]|nr:MBL fold metallo-hydrolase [Odoribacter sp. OttesenSCG-928-A06]
MKITYIYHSGFAIETERAVIIIDYYKEPTCSTGISVSDLLKGTKKPVYVLSSHAHPDHFNPAIMQWRRVNPTICYILSKDIFHAGFVAEGEAFFLDCSESFRDNNLSVKAFGSTDAGISFLLEVGDKTIFHAGDLNNWHWNEESTKEEVEEAENNFLKEVDELAKEVCDIDVVFFPVDPRLGKDYMRGAEQFTDRIKVHFFLPMHYGDAYDKALSFKFYAENRKVCFIELPEPGATVNLK